VEALKVLLGAGDPLIDQLLLWDGLRATFDLVRFERDANCPVCGVL
jgi:adenylyltransferase/sulfurtransferase